MDCSHLLGLPLGLVLSAGFTLTAHAQISTSTEAVPPLTLDQPMQTMTLTLDAMDYPTYNALLQQANQSAATLIEAAFRENPGWTAVSVHILGANSGTIVPLLTTQVSRSDWQSRPEIDPWGQWMGRSAQQLLGMGAPEQLSTGSTAVAPSRSSKYPTPRGRSSRIRRLLSGE